MAKILKILPYPSNRPSDPKKSNKYLHRLFESQGRLQHGDKYDYSNLVFDENTRVGTKQIIVCDVHDEFMQSYTGHCRAGYGCNKCAYALRRISAKKTHADRRNPKKSKNEFVRAAKKIHGDVYDYSKIHFDVNQTNGFAQQKVEILCKIHGSFWQSKSTHTVTGHGCAKCAQIKNRKNSQWFQTKTEYKDFFILQSKKVHGELYDYSKVNFSKLQITQKVEILCKIHGSFWQNGQFHYYKEHGCPKCDNKGFSQEELNLNAHKIIKKTFGKLYDTSLINYPPDKQRSYKIKLICKKHGVFRRNIRELGSGKGCLQCSQHSSGKEDQICAFIGKLRPDLTIIRNTNKIIKSRISGYPVELDIYLPELKLAIEYCGFYWHSTLAGKDKYYHQDKFLACKKKGIKLITIFDYDAKTKWYRLLDRMRHSLNKAKYSVYARKCDIRYVSIVDTKDFLSRNHLQGYCNSAVNIGLYYDEELVSLMTFGKSRYSDKIEWELLRFCSLKMHSVAGGMSKLFKYFVDGYSPVSIVSYADLRYGQGDSYTTLGFLLEKIGMPTPWYKFKDSKKILHRTSVQKHKLANLLPNFDSNLTQDQNLFNSGWDQIYDCGQATYLWKTPNRRRKGTKNTRD